MKPLSRIVVTIVVLNFYAHAAPKPHVYHSAAGPPFPLVHRTAKATRFSSKFARYMSMAKRKNSLLAPPTTSPNAPSQSNESTASTIPCPSRPALRSGNGSAAAGCWWIG